ncbi:MAG: hypothetical protein M1543_02350 [Firmicutes bacterium]|nr:hypothetical protein [Bacillota bacterium]
MDDVISLATLPWRADERFGQAFPYLDGELKHAMDGLATVMSKVLAMPKHELVIAVQLQGQRICTSLLTAVRCLEEGFICEAAVLAIGAVESSWYIELFMLKPHLASRWLEGTEYPSKEIRKKLANPNEKKETYQKLAQFAHSNYFSVPQKRLYRKSRDTEHLALEQTLGVLLIREIGRNIEMLNKFVMQEGR